MLQHAFRFYQRAAAPPRQILAPRKDKLSGGAMLKAATSASLLYQAAVRGSPAVKNVSR